MFRSEDMSLYEVTVNTESTWDLLNTFGLSQKVMFAGTPREIVNDKNAHNQLRQCDELCNKLEFIKSKAEFFEVTG